MRVLNWLRDATKGGTTAGLLEATTQFAEEEARFHGLDVRRELKAHIGQIVHLEDILSGKCDDYPEQSTLASDCECTMGQWLHGQAEKMLGDSGDYKELLKSHADFHQNAAEVLKDFLHGQAYSAELNMQKLRVQSDMMQLALVRLFSNEKG